jgi:hypothetical protein
VGLCGEESCGVEGLWNLEDRCISLGISILSRGTRRSMKQRNKKEQEAEEQEGTGSRGTRRNRKQRNKKEQEAEEQEGTGSRGTRGT